MVHEVKKLSELSPEEAQIIPTYAARGMTEPVPKFELPENGMAPGVAYNLIRDELLLDGNAKLNLATFVTTQMDEEADKLMAATFEKNMIDKDEYPATAAVEEACVNMVSRLFNASDSHAAVGVSTIGSSEAVMLAGLALKWKWRERMKAQGKPIDKPNMVMGINVQVVWEKFCRYWDVEPRYVPVTKERHCLGAEEALRLVDENTIGVIPILGSTYTGQFEPVKEVHDALVKLNREKGWEVPVHVDAASGGFVAPFLHPDLEWDFRLPMVKSINASGHKYGLVYPGVGWVVWRDKEDLPEDLVFHVNYLGGDMPTFTLNFSRSATQVIGQYYNFLRLGKSGYRRIMETLRDISLYLAEQISKMGRFEILADGSDMPVVAFKLNDPKNYTVFDLSDKLRAGGWQVPAYTMPPDDEDTAILRIVVREGFNRTLADALLRDLQRAIKHFEDEGGRSKEPKAQFRH